MRFPTEWNFLLPPKIVQHWTSFHHARMTPAPSRSGAACNPEPCRSGFLPHRLEIRMISPPKPPSWRRGGCHSASPVAARAPPPPPRSLRDRRRQRWGTQAMHSWSSAARIPKPRRSGFLPRHLEICVISPPKPPSWHRRGGHNASQAAARAPPPRSVAGSDGRLKQRSWGRLHATWSLLNSCAVKIAGNMQLRKIVSNIRSHMLSCMNSNSSWRRLQATWSLLNYQAWVWEACQGNFSN
jgi:hypothetical protein